MKKTAFLLMVVFFSSACSSTKEITGSRSESRELKRLAEQAVIKEAVESRRFVIKVDRLHTLGGRSWELVPTNNFIIINGEIASLSVGYIGRSYGVRPISGINLNGHATDYKMVSDEAKKMYKIEMVVKSGNEKFNVYLTIGNGGYCSMSLINNYIQTVSYSGTLVPLGESKKNSVEKVNKL